MWHNIDLHPSAIMDTIDKDFTTSSSKCSELASYIVRPELECKRRHSAVHAWPNLIVAYIPSSMHAVRQDFNNAVATRFAMGSEATNPNAG